MMYNEKSCHIWRRHNIVIELLSSEIIKIDFVKSKDNVSNSLTKGLTREGIERLWKGMGYGRGQVIVAETLTRSLEIPRSRFKEIKQSH